MTDTTPSERRHARTRQAIIDAAREILLHEGIEALSMRSLAEQVDYSPAALYKYFDSKEAILDALRREGWQRAAEMQQQAAQPNTSVMEQLITSGQTYLKFARTYPELYQLMFSSAESGPQESLSEIMENTGFQGLVNAIKNSGFNLPEGVTPEHMAWQLWFVVHGIATLRTTLMSNVQKEFDVWSEEIMSQYLRGLVNKP